MAENHHLAWRWVETERKANREKSRAANTDALRSAGILFHVLDNGCHLRIFQNGEQIDFMPGPGTWSIAGKRSASHGQHRGVQSLIEYLNGDKSWTDR